jgi:AcrR family transcriptional regulator
MPAGRQRAFDTEKALDQALTVFWRKGYEGASLPDLTKAMGINKPSLYAAFGNKESLFRQAIDRYVAGPACHIREALDSPTARGVVERWLLGGIELVTGEGRPAGCFMVQGALACGEQGEIVKEEMAKRRVAGETALRHRFERAIQEGDLPSGGDAASLATYVVAIAYGMAVQAAGGAKADDLRKIAEMVIASWPPRGSG